MSCCGSRRASMRYDPRVDIRNANRWSAGRTELMFSGQGRLTVTGPVTGIEYEFISGGPPLRVHPWDFRSLAATSALTPPPRPV
jgi:hypothetical protein